MQYKHNFNTTLLNTQFLSTQIQSEHRLTCNPHIGQSVQAEAEVGNLK